MNSINQEIIDDANSYGEFLRLTVHERSLPSDTRTRAAASCFAIAQDHHHGIIVLLHARLYASSFSLLRVAFEAYVRGEWLRLAATEDQVNDFMSDRSRPEMSVLLSGIEGRDEFISGDLKAIKQRVWGPLCSYTHTGGLHVQRWNTSDSIEPAYELQELLEVLQFAEIVASLSVIAVLGLADDVSTAEEVLAKFKAKADRVAPKSA